MIMMIYRIGNYLLDENLRVIRTLTQKMLKKLGPHEVHLTRKEAAHLLHMLLQETAYMNNDEQKFYGERFR